MKARLIMISVFSVEIFVLYLLLSPSLNMLLGVGNSVDGNKSLANSTIVLGSESLEKPLPFPCSSMVALLTSLRLDSQEYGKDVIYIGAPIALHLNVESVDQDAFHNSAGDYLGILDQNHQMQRNNWTVVVEIRDSNNIAVAINVNPMDIGDSNNTQTSTTITIQGGVSQAGENSIRVFLVSNPNLELADVLSPVHKLRVTAINGTVRDNKAPLVPLTSNLSGNSSKNMANLIAIPYDDFSGDPYTLEDGEFSPDCKWQSVHNGYGKLGVRSETGTEKENGVFFERPAESVGPSGVNQDNRTTYGTHAGLALTTIHDYKNFHLSLDVKATKQLRTINPANPWETAWIMFHYIDDWHHYYIIPKPDGIELGKKDNDSHLEEQIDLTSFDDPESSIGSWQHVDLFVKENHISAYVNGSSVLDYIDGTMDTDKFGKGGAIGLYCEDAEVLFDNVHITRLP